MALSAIVVVGSLVLIGGHLRFRARRDRRYLVAPIDLRVGADPETVARGEHIARSLAGCAVCHGADLSGRVVADTAMMRVVAPNLTRGRGSGVTGYRDEDWARAIVHGVDRAGRGLLIMPSKELAAYANDDVAAVIAFLKSVPPVDRTLPTTEIGAIGGAVLGLLRAPLWSAELIDHLAPRPITPAPGPTRIYGEYLVQMCRGCHGADLRGGIKHKPATPASADLSPPAMARWEYNAFVRALREGKRRDGSQLDNEAMPWQATQGLNDDELRAIWLALRAG